MIPNVVQLNRFAGPDDLHNTLWHPQVRAAQEWLLAGQHRIRGWEYSQARYAVGEEGAAMDVGAAGSRFYAVLNPPTGEGVVRVDPTFAHEFTLGDQPAHAPDGSLVWARTLEDLPPQPRYRRLTCISVIEHLPLDHVTDVFIPALAQRLAPGGRLGLTCDATPERPEPDPHDPTGKSPWDPFHFHWMRKWIATPVIIQDRLLPALQDCGFDLLPGHALDLTPRGRAVFDYTMLSLALVRRRSR